MNLVDITDQHRVVMGQWDKVKVVQLDNLYEPYCTTLATEKSIIHFLINMVGVGLINNGQI